MIRQSRGLGSSDWVHCNEWFYLKTLPKSTYQEHCDQTLLKDQYTEKEVGKLMVNTGTFHHIALDNRYADRLATIYISSYCWWLTVLSTNFRDTGRPEKGHGSVLPHHHPDHDRFRASTTYNHDYQLPYPYSPNQVCSPPLHLLLVIKTGHFIVICLINKQEAVQVWMVSYKCLTAFISLYSFCAKSSALNSNLRAAAYLPRLHLITSSSWEIKVTRL